MSKYAHALAGIAHENNILKLLILFLGITTLTLGVLASKIISKPPLIIERGCLSKALATVDATPTAVEVEAFLKEALSQRFNSDDGSGSPLLSLQAIKDRDSEQSELGRRNIKQRVFVNQVMRDDGNTIVDADRILSVGPLRSAYSFKLSIQFEPTQRSSSNPYGLILTQAQVVKSPDKASSDTQGNSSMATSTRGQHP